MVVIFGAGRLRFEVEAGAVRMETIDGAQVPVAILATDAVSSERWHAPIPEARTAVALAAIAADPAGDHSAATLADRLGVSVRHLNRMFAEHVGVTPARHVERVRVAIARDLLATTDARLATIAAQAGFGSAETMRRAFLRADGSPPGAYRDGLAPAALPATATATRQATTDTMSGSESHVSLPVGTDAVHAGPRKQADEDPRSRHAS